MGKSVQSVDGGRYLGRSLPLPPGFENGGADIHAQHHDMFCLWWRWDDMRGREGGRGARSPYLFVAVFLRSGGAEYEGRWGLRKGV